MGAVVSLDEARVKRSCQRAAGKSHQERRRVYDFVNETWLDWSEVERFKSVSHQSIVAFEASRKDREFARFLGKLKGDAGRDPLNSLCQFGVVCAATQAAILAGWATAIVLTADTLLNQSQVILAHASSLLREIHSRKGDGNCLSPIHRSSPSVHP